MRAVARIRRPLVRMSASVAAGRWPSRRASMDYDASAVRFARGAVEAEAGHFSSNTQDRHLLYIIFLISVFSAASCLWQGTVGSRPRAWRTRKFRPLLPDEHCPTGRQRLDQFAACSVRCRIVLSGGPHLRVALYATGNEIVDQTLSPQEHTLETTTARSPSRDYAGWAEKAEAWSIVGMTTPA